eukprot:s240_g41.t1
MPRCCPATTESTSDYEPPATLKANCNPLVPQVHNYKELRDLSSALQQALAKLNEEVEQKVVMNNGTPKAEYRVYSAFLAAWSEQLSQQVALGKRWEVHNFSVAAVDSFLRFLYTGSMPSNTTVAMEAALMAEVYGVQEPGKSVEATLRGNVPIRDIYAMLEVAHRFPDHGVQVRSACLRALLADPEQSLREAWTLNSRILEELLSLASNDIGDFELAKMIISWQEAWEQNPHQNFADILQEHVSFGGFNDERFQEIRTSSAVALCYHADRVGLGFLVDTMWAEAQASSGEWTPDFFRYLESKWELQCQEHRRNMPFIGVWINLIPSNLGWKAPLHSHGPHKAQDLLVLPLAAYSNLCQPLACLQAPTLRLLLSVCCPKDKFPVDCNGEACIEIYSSSLFKLCRFCTNYDSGKFSNFHCPTWHEQVEADWKLKAMWRQN